MPSYDGSHGGTWRASDRSHTLQASALVNEAYLRLIDLKQMQWQNRAHFFAMSACNAQLLGPFAVLRLGREGSRLEP